MNANRTIRDVLKANPGMTYIAPGQKKLFLLLDNNEVMCLEGNFVDMTDQQVNDFIVENLKRIIEEKLRNVKA